MGATGRNRDIFPAHLSLLHAAETRHFKRSQQVCSTLVGLKPSFVGAKRAIAKLAYDLICPSRHHCPALHMNLPTKAVWLAVHRIFSEEHVAAGCSLPLKHLMTVWARTGMRMRDLAEGLETLASSGYMSVEMSQDGPCARLIDEQFGLTNGDAQDRHAVSTVQNLRTARTRPSHLGTLLGRGDGRRQEDRPLGAYAAA